MNNISGLTVILPTINEEENLKILIPQIIIKFKEIDLTNYEIIVVDDSSEDNTSELINKFNANDDRVKIFQRNTYPSLPMSIWDGISKSQNDFVAWLDADGSMPAETLKLLILDLEKNPSSVVIGSRFADGGGYKGIEEFGKTSFINAVKNVYKSNDSVFGMIFSTLFNKFLKIIFKTDISDITSGFIVANKSNFTKNIFENANYGDYFIYLVADLINNKKEIREVGYICETRLNGVSKTSTNIFQLISRGIPYIKVAMEIRKR